MTTGNVVGAGPKPTALITSKPVEVEPSHAQNLDYLTLCAGASDRMVRAHVKSIK